MISQTSRAEAPRPRPGAHAMSGLTCRAEACHDRKPLLGIKGRDPQMVMIRPRASMYSIALIDVARE